MIVQLMKALYGIVEAPKLWYDTLSAYLISVGSKRSELDICYFVKDLQFGKKMDVCVHVDDGKATSDDEEELDQLMQGLKEKFKIIKVHKGLIFNHLGMHYVYDGKGHVDISMIPFTQQLVKTWVKCHGLVRCTSCPRLFCRDNNGSSNIWKILYNAVHDEPRPAYLCRQNPVGPP